jgi:DNA replicative helicase MCM subunit Mcm2 (Cdc46/Mcm family)
VRGYCEVDTDKLVSIKGLVIRATPVIPDMKLGELGESNEIQMNFPTQLTSSVVVPLQPSSAAWFASTLSKKRSTEVGSTSRTSAHENSVARRGR